MAEKILVVLQPGESLRSLEYALSLGDRVRGKVFILLISPEDQSVERFKEAGRGAGRTLDEALRMALEAAQRSGLEASYYRAGGDTVEQAAKFVREQSIDLVVLMAGESSDPEVPALGEQIRRRSGCRVIMVGPEREHPWSEI